MMATRGRGGGADYDHLIKLLLIGDSGERYRLRPPGLLCDSRYCPIPTDRGRAGPRRARLVNSRACLGATNLGASFAAEKPSVASSLAFPPLFPARIVCGRYQFPS